MGQMAGWSPHQSMEESGMILGFFIRDKKTFALELKENGKVIGDSYFFLIANDLLSNETKRLCDFTDALDKSLQQKKEMIAEYKCAKYRYASVVLIESTVYHNNRCRKLHNIEYSHYLLRPFDDLLRENAEYLALYESAPKSEKPDYSLYYSMLIFIERKLGVLNEKIPNASDWEKVELDERIGGLKFAKECLNEAWQRRRDMIE